MKCLKFMMAAGALTRSVSCVENDLTVEPKTPRTRSISGNGIECIDGTLHFASPEICLETMDA